MSFPNYTISYADACCQRLAIVIDPRGATGARPTEAPKHHVRTLRNAKGEGCLARIRRVPFRWEAVTSC